MLADYRLSIRGPGHQKLAGAIERGITRASDLCDIHPPVCKANLGIPRSAMPQFSAPAVREAFVESLRERGIRVTNAKRRVGQLKASQEEIQVKRVMGILAKYMAGKYPGIRRSVLVSRDDYIVDGHHRWAVLLMTDPGDTISVIRVDMPIRPLLRMANEFPGVEQRPFDAEEFSPGLHSLIEYAGLMGMPDPQRAPYFAPMAGYRLIPTDPMASSRHVRRPSGREQRFVLAGDPSAEKPSPRRYEPAKDAARRVAGGAAVVARPVREGGQRAAPALSSLFEIIAPEPRMGAPFSGYPSIPVGSLRGVGVSPSASPADREAGRHQVVVGRDGIPRKRRSGSKPMRAGYGTLAIPKLR